MKHIVGFSGGIDSQATARWVRERVSKEDVLLFNSPAGDNEDPLTTDFVEWYSANVHPVIQVSAICSDINRPGGRAKLAALGYGDGDKLTFDMLAIAKGRFPSRKAQFCTEVLKLVPQRRWITKEFGPGGQWDGEDYERYAGVRADESKSRSLLEPRVWDDYFDCFLNRPVLTWTKKECFDYVLAGGEKINDLYTLGFNRVGCAPCINSGKDDLMAWLQRRPEIIEKIRRYEERVQRTYFAPMVPGMAINWIDDVVLWAQTSRGGRQQNMLRVLNDRPACESKYGLCE